MNPLSKQVDGTHYTALKVQPIELAYAVAKGDVCFTLVAKYLIRDKFDANGNSLREIDLTKAVHAVELASKFKHLYEVPRGRSLRQKITDFASQRPVDQLNIDGALRALLNRDFQHAIECIQDIRI